MINLLTMLKTQDNFSHNEQIIVDYILEHPYEVVGMTTNQLCQKCYVSHATIYRLCEKLNLSGFSDLKVKISNSLHDFQKENDDFDFDFPIKQDQTHYEIIKRIKEDYERTLVLTTNLFSLNQLKIAVQAMKSAQVIDVYTSAGNVFFAENFKFQMKEIGVEIHVPIEEYQQKLYAATSDSSHLAIIISFGGRGMLVESIAHILNERKTPILLISAYEMKLKGATPLCRLYISSHENHYKKISSYSTRLSILFILDVLYTCYFKLDYQNNIDKKMKYYNLMRK